MYIGKYRPKHPALHIRLHRQLHLSLYLDLDLDLNRDLYLSLYRALFAKSYGSLLQQLLTTLLGSMLSLMLIQSQILSRPATRLAKLPPRRPLPMLLVTGARSEAIENALVRRIPGPSESRALVYCPARTHLPVRPPPGRRPYSLNHWPLTPSLVASDLRPLPSLLPRPAPSSMLTSSL